MRWITPILLTPLLWGCLSPTSEETVYACLQEADCTQGYTCVRVANAAYGRCVDTAQSPDTQAAPDTSSSDIQASDTTATDTSVQDSNPDIDAPRCTPSSDYCADLPRLLEEPVLDGVVDCGLALVEVDTTHWDSDAPFPAGAALRYAAAWRPNGLYVFFDVDDPDRFPGVPDGHEVFCGDSVEAYVDADGDFPNAPQYEDPGATQLVVEAPHSESMDGTFAQRYRDSEPLGDIPQALFVSTPRPGGYTVELFVGAEELDLNAWTLQARKDLGFSIGLNLSTPDGTTTNCGLRQGQLLLTRESSFTPPQCNGQPYCDVRSFCTPMLIE